MKPFVEFFNRIFACRISQMFFAANLAICTAAFDWEKCFAYLKWLDRIGCKPKPKGISFGLYDISGGNAETGLMLLVLTGYLILLVIFAIFFMPSIAFTEIILSFLTGIFPAACDETFDLITIPIFMLINGIYWILLGRLIEHCHSEIIQNRPPRENPLSIFSG